MNIFSFLRALLIVCLVGGFTSCSLFSPTYQSLTTHKYPPKPKDYPIPLFSPEPREKFQVIGRLILRGTDYSDDNTAKSTNKDDLIRDIQNKARRVGADAVVMIKSDWHVVQDTHYYPGSWSDFSPPSPPSAPPKNATKSEMADYRRSAGQCSPREYTPAYTRTKAKTTYTFEAQMIVYK